MSLERLPILLLLLLVSGCGGAGQRGTLLYLSRYESDAQLRALFVVHGGPLVIVGEGVFAPPLACLDPSTPGIAEARSLGGRAEARNIGGATQTRNTGGATEARNVGGGAETRNTGGRAEARNTAGGTEVRNIGGETEARNTAAGTEARNIGGETEARNTAVGAERYDCFHLNGRRFAVSGVGPGGIKLFDGRGVVPKRPESIDY